VFAWLQFYLFVPLTYKSKIFDSSGLLTKFLAKQKKSRANPGTIYKDLKQI
jgi:hypothetical protein